MQLNLQNKTVLVTGASGGIGRATALALADAGATVIVHYNKNMIKAEETMKMLKNGNHMLLQSDLVKEGEPEKALDEVVGKYGRLDILVNNAGIFKEINFDAAGIDDWKNHWDETFGINIRAVSMLTFLTAKHMVEKGGGKIINVSSRGAFRGEPNAPAYGASKAAMNAFSQSLAKLLGGKNIFLFVVAPGFVDTEMSSYAMEGSRGEEIKAQSPLNRIASPEEVAQTIVYLAAGKTDFLTGSIIDINGASFLRN